MITHFKELHLNNIKHCLNTGVDWSTKDSLPVQHVLDILLDVGCTLDEDSFEKNGFQYDWWYKFTYGGRLYTVEGCGFWGGLRIWEEK